MESSTQQFFSNLRWACVGAAGVMFVVAYRRLCSRKVFSQDHVLPSYNHLKSWGLDYGSSMADNYFYGCLDIILPAGHSNNPGFADRVADYKREQKMSDVMSDKMFVIIHKSGRCPDTYEKVLPERFYARPTKMQVQVDARNGVRRMKYQSTVYKISSEDKKESINVVMEGAPCLRQVYESSLHSAAVRAMSDDIIETIFEQLQKKINESDKCRGLCELIPFDPEKDGYNWLADEIIRRASA